jgi:hypothetical protein
VGTISRRVARGIFGRGRGLGRGHGSEARDSEDEVRVGAELEKAFSLRWRRHARVVHDTVESLGDDLEVDVRWPASVLLEVADLAKGMSLEENIAGFEPFE